MTTPSLTSFKRLAIGATFTCAAKGADTHGTRFRKVDERGAYALIAATDKTRPNRGQTHKAVPFARSHSVAV